MMNFTPVGVEGIPGCGAPHFRFPARRLSPLKYMKYTSKQYWKTFVAKKYRGCGGVSPAGPLTSCWHPSLASAGRCVLAGPRVISFFFCLLIENGNYVPLRLLTGSPDFLRPRSFFSALVVGKSASMSTTQL